MWKKDEEPNGASEQPEKRIGALPSRRSSGGAKPATIGPSITIKGEVSGDEDLLIQGRIDGSVDLEEHALTVGSEGRVKANIVGRIVTVEGEVEGDLKATEQVILRSDARVDGDITAPRVVLEDGARFRGLVDMGEASKKGRPSSDRGTKSSEAGNASTSGSGPGSNGVSTGSSTSAKGSAEKSAKATKADRAKATT